MGTNGGVTLVEVLVVLAVFAISVFVGVRFGGSTAEVDARRLALAIARERMRAVVTGHVTELSCTDATRHSPAPHLTSSATWPQRGLLFTPDGLHRSCDGGGVGNTTILLEHRGRQAAVIVSSLGRVRWEQR